MTESRNDSINNAWVDLVTLGGLGEIGLNSMVLSSGSDMVIIDSGLMFPESHMYGVDVVIPDFSYVLENAEMVRGIVLTHGHEDHIGALPFLLRQLNVPVYGSRFTLELVKNRLKEHGITDIELILVEPRDTISLGVFTFEFIKVSHSIVDGFGLAITTPAGRIVHSGDFKVEQSPISGQEIDLNKFAEKGEEGVMALLSDSTNVERPGYTMSESSIGQSIRDIFGNCTGRIIVAVFASNINRIRQVVDIATEFKRRVAFNGRSMVGNVRIARELGYLDLLEGQEISFKKLNSIPDEKVVLITTGTQGEPMSALTRMAQGDHKQISIKPGDVVVLSSKFIPGNEKNITAIINNLYRLGAEVIYEKVSEIHVSGHAYQEELKLMINLTKPRFFMPIHGEYRHLKKHTQLAEQVGIPQENLILAENGEVIRFDGDGWRRVGEIRTDRILVDGKGVGDVGRAVLKDRHHMAENGMVIPLLVMKERTGEIISGPDIISKGFVFEDDAPDLYEEARMIILRICEKRTVHEETGARLTIDPEELKAEIHLELKRLFNKTLDRRPLIIPQIITV